MNRTAFPVLIGRALTLVSRHALLYACIALAAMAIEWCVYRFYNLPAIVFASGIVVGAFVDAIVFAQSKGDVDGWSSAQVWGRVLERLWAVVVVNFIFTYVLAYAFALLAEGDAVGRILAIPIFLIAVATIFAEAIAVVVDEEHWWFLIVRALGTSIRTAWTGTTMWRAIALFILVLLPNTITAVIGGAFAHGRSPAASFWSDVPLGIVFSIPLDALIVLAFFDASGYEPDRTCGE